MKLYVLGNNSLAPGGGPLLNYGRSMCEAFQKLGHEVLFVDKAKALSDPFFTQPDSSFDWIIDIDSGRDKTGIYWFLGGKIETSKVKKAVIFIDSHGHPDYHKELAQYYDHVFFAVWFRRDLFTEHKSTHWLPNFTDSKWFYPITDCLAGNISDFGFFGSKGGLSRAEPLKELCDKLGYSYDIRQINNQFKQRWPYTCEAMNRCEVLFNHGQKHDGPNLRVMESMACNIPLITDYDPKSGMKELFSSYKHYIPYEAYTYRGLDEAVSFCLNNPTAANEIAENAFKEVTENHLVEHRVQQILEVIADE